MAEINKNNDEHIVSNETVVDIDTGDSDVSSGMGGNAKYITIVASVVLSVLILFFVFSGNKKEDILDPNEILINTERTNTNNTNNIDSLVSTNYSNPSYVDNSNTLELPKLPELPDNVKNDIESSMKNLKEKEENTYTKEEVDNMISDKLKQFEDEMNKIKNESQRLAKELEQKDDIKNTEKDNKKNKNTTSISLDITPPIVGLENNSGIPINILNDGNIKSQEDLKNNEEKELKLAQRARIMEERKASPMFKMQGGGGGNSNIIDQDSIVVLNKDSLQKINETKVENITTKISDLSRIVMQGKIITAVLETAINTDIKAPVRAIVSRDVYSELGKNILIPKGSRLIGSFQNISKTGVSRLSITWNRIIRVDGLNVSIGSEAVDDLGRGGVEGELDNKYAQAMRNAFLSSMVSIATAVLVEKVTDSTGVSQTTTDGKTSTTSGKASDYAIINATEDFSDEMQDMIDNLKNESPTIRIAQGTKINVLVNQDLTLPIFKQNGKKVK